MGWRLLPQPLAWFCCYWRWALTNLLMKFPMQGCSVENMGWCTSFFLLLILSSKGDCPPLFCELMQLCLTSMDFGEVNRSCYLMLFFVSFCCTGLWGTSSTINKKILTYSIFKLEQRGRWQLQLRLHLVLASLLPWSNLSGFPWVITRGESICTSVSVRINEDWSLKDLYLMTTSSDVYWSKNTKWNFLCNWGPENLFLCKFFAKHHCML